MNGEPQTTTVWRGRPERAPRLRRTRAYVSGPYTLGDPLANTRRAIDAANALLVRGYAPFVPHLTLWWDLQYPQTYETWMAYDFTWLDACDVLLRLPGESCGGDRETLHARIEGIPVYHSLDSLVAGTTALCVA